MDKQEGRGDRGASPNGVLGLGRRGNGTGLASRYSIGRESSSRALSGTGDEQAEPNHTHRNTVITGDSHADPQQTIPAAGGLVRSAVDFTSTRPARSAPSRNKACRLKRSLRIRDLALQRLCASSLGGLLEPALWLIAALSVAASPLDRTLHVAKDLGTAPGLVATGCVIPL
jgi:hypothetical protein